MRGYSGWSAPLLIVYKITFPYYRNKTYSTDHVIGSILHGDNENLFIFSLFNKAPGSFEKFNSLFAGRAKSDIAGSSELAAQAQSFKGALDMFIDNMDNANVLNIQIGRFCKLHKARGVGAADMEVSRIYPFSRDLTIPHLDLSHFALCIMGN